MLAIALLMILPSCASVTSTSATNGSACEVWKDISWSSKDTDQTIKDIKVNNARRDGWCK
jgi:hypothetical protein